MLCSSCSGFTTNLTGRGMQGKLAENLAQNGDPGANAVQAAGNDADDDGGPGLHGGAAARDGHQAGQRAVAHRHDVVHYLAWVRTGTVTRKSRACFVTTRLFLCPAACTQVGCGVQQCGGVTNSSTFLWLHTAAGMCFALAVAAAIHTPAGHSSHSSSGQARFLAGMCSCNTVFGQERRHASSVRLFRSAHPPQRSR